MVLCILEDLFGRCTVQLRLHIVYGLILTYKLDNILVTDSQTNASSVHRFQIQRQCSVCVCMCVIVCVCVCVYVCAY